MGIPTIPQNLDDWNIDVIDSLLDVPTIESETLECKREINPSSLPKHICAMANVRGGFILVGLDEKKTSDGKKSGYGKTGLNLDEDEINQRMSSAVYEIEPTPMVKSICIPDGAKTYAVIHIPEEKSKKPFFVKNGGCHIRVGSSSLPASRSIVMSLFEGLEKKRNLISFVASLKMLKAELGATRAYMKSISPGDQTRPAQVDVEFVVTGVIKNQAFLVENGLFGENDSGPVQGILKAIQTIRQLNVQIAAYNTMHHPDLKARIRNRLYTSSDVLSCNLDETPSLIEKVVSVCQDTIDKYE